jgi:Protein of unknown function (DUF3592)
LDVGFAVLWIGICVAIGIALVVLGRQRDRWVERLRRVGRRTSAVVVDYHYERDADGDATPYPLVRFQVSDGRLVTAQADSGGSLVPEIGEQVEVLFDPDRPEEVHLDTRLSNQATALIGWIGWGMIVVGALVAVAVLFIAWPAAGIVASLAGVVLAVVAVRQRRARPQPPAPAAQPSPGGQGTVPQGRQVAPARSGSGSSHRRDAVASVVLIVFMLAGVVLLGLSGKSLMDDRRFLAKAAVATGVVVDIARVVDQDDKVAYYPVVEFTTAREQVVRFEADEATSDPDRQLGASVRILYDPANPHDARLDTFMSRWGLSIVMGMLGLGFVAVPAFFFLLVVRRKQRQGSL